MNEGLKRGFAGWLAAALCAGLLFSGCARESEYTPAMELSGDEPPQVLFGAERIGSFTESLYFLSEDETELAAEEHVIDCSGNMSRAESAIGQMIKGPTSRLLHASVPASLALERVELSADALNVYLVGEELPSIRAWLIARCAIAATAYECEGIGSVNLYFNGKEPGYLGRPLGAAKPLEGELDTYLANMQQEYEILPLQPSPENWGDERRSATLYFSDFERELLIARSREIEYSRTETEENIAAQLIAELVKGDEAMQPVLPEDFVLLEPPQIIEDTTETTLYKPDATWEQPGSENTEPETVTLTERFVRLVIAEPAAGDEAIMCGALTLTLAGYLPNISGVAIVARQQDGTERALFADQNYFTRDDFTSIVGHTVQLTFPAEDGSALLQVPRAIQSENVYDPYTHLIELFKGPADPGVLYPLFTEADVNQVYIVGDIAIVDWTEGFAQKLRDMIESGESALPQDRRERLFLYSVINTLTELPGVQRVWMTENGQKLGAVQDIYLGNALLRNPGILLSE